MNTLTDTQTVHLPLGRLALCLDCDMCFDVGRAACPACASTSWVTVASFLERSEEAKAR